MAEQCTVINCTEQPKWQCYVHSGNDTRQSPHSVYATYCDEHLASQKQRMDAHEFLVLTDVERLPDAETGRRLASEREDLIAAGVNPGDLVIPIHPKDHVTLPECRHLICERPAEFEVTVRYFGGVRERKALYCTTHLTVVQEALATRETSEITNIRPLRGTDMTEEQSTFSPGDRVSYGQGTVVSILNDNVEVEWDFPTLRAVRHLTPGALTKMAESPSAAAENLIANQREEIGTLRGDRDALVNALHGLGNEMDAIGNDDAVRLIDDVLEKGKYPARIKHFEIIVTVPAQVRIKVDAKDKDTAREMFDQGKVGWRSEDYEEFLEDDTKIVEIVEVEQ